MRRTVYSRTGLVIVIALAACSAVLFWRVSTLVELAPVQERPPAGQTEDSGWFVVYQQSRVISRGAEAWANDDILEHRFVRQARGGGRAEMIDSVTTDSQLGYDNPWMMTNGDRELLFFRRRASADDIVRIDVMGQAAADQDGEWGRALPSPDGRSLAVVSGTNSGMIRLRLADGTIKDVSTSGLATVGYLMPEAWSPDGEVLYLRVAFEGGGYISGLWSMDIASGEMTEIKAVRQLGLMHYSVYPSLGLVVGSVFSSDDTGRSPIGPSMIYSVDLASGETAELAKSKSESLAFLNPLLSPDGKKLVYGIGSGSQEAGDVWLAEIGGNTPGAPFISGRALAWTPDGRSLIIDRDNELQIVDIKTSEITTIAERRGRYNDPDYQGLEFIGIIRH